MVPLPNGIRFNTAGIARPYCLWRQWDRGPTDNRCATHFHRDPINADDFTVDVEGWDHGPTPVRQPFLTVRVALSTEAKIVWSG